MKKRDPHVVLGLDPGASPAAVKSAWRRLARANHPDLNAGDPAAARAATTRMVEINDAYERLRKALKAEIDEAAWASLNATVSRPFATPSSGRIAVKVINHYGDEVMHVYDVPEISQPSDAHRGRARPSRAKPAG